MIAGLYDAFNFMWNKYQTIYLISDTHFDDKDLYVGTKKIERANSDDYVKLINSKAGRKDLLIHLGDVGNLEQIAKIRADKLLIMGNHDTGATKYKRQKWKEIFDKDKYTKAEALAEMKKLYPNCRYDVYEDYSFHQPFERWEVLADNALFNWVFEGPVQIGEKLILSHEPINCDWAFNIHGHVHSYNYKDDERHLCICPEVTGTFEPVNFNKLMKSGLTSKIKTLHRDTIDGATKRAKKRGKKLGQKK